MRSQLDLNFLSFPFLSCHLISVLLCPPASHTLFKATDLGRIASHYYVTYTTLAAFNEHLKPTMTDIELLRLFALADEFKYMVRTC